jgi:hypothetical protein
LVLASFLPLHNLTFDLIRAHIYMTVTLELKELSSTLGTSQSVEDALNTGVLPYHHFVDVCGPFINNQFRAMRLWSPDFIPFASPLTACALIVSASANMAKNAPEGELTASDTQNSLEAAISGFVLRRFSDYWPLGTSMEGESNCGLCSLTLQVTNYSPQGFLKSLISFTVPDNSNLTTAPTPWVQGLIPTLLRAGP